MSAEKQPKKVTHVFMTLVTAVRGADHCCGCTRVITLSLGEHFFVLLKRSDSVMDSLGGASYGFLSHFTDVLMSDPWCCMRTVEAHT